MASLGGRLEIYFRTCRDLEGSAHSTQHKAMAQAFSRRVLALFYVLSSLFVLLYCTVRINGNGVYLASGPVRVSRYSQEVATVPHKHLGLEIAKWGYTELKLELHKLNVEIERFCQQAGVLCLQERIEAELTYIRLRRVKPSTIWEISPSHGFSTLVILLALKENKSGELFSFDIHNASLQFLGAEYQGITTPWHFVQGDIREVVLGPLLQRHRPDYLLLDSYHSAEFGEFYVTTLLPEIQKVHTYVSLHDVYNPGFWSDDKKKPRDTAVYPRSLPNEEGIVVLDWLNYRYLSNSCNLYTFAVSKLMNARFVEELLVYRREADLSDPTRALVESTIFFELGCDAEFHPFDVSQTHY